MTNQLQLTHVSLLKVCGLCMLDNRRRQYNIAIVRLSSCQVNNEQTNPIEPPFTSGLRSYC